MQLGAGQLDRSIRLERLFAETSTDGQVINRWALIATVWARMEPLGGTRNFGQQQFIAVGDVRFTIRWRDDVTTNERIVYGGREYEVVSVAEVGRRLFLMIVAKVRAEAREDREGT